MASSSAPGQGGDRSEEQAIFCFSRIPPQLPKRQSWVRILARPLTDQELLTKLPITYSSLRAEYRNDKTSLPYTGVRAPQGANGFALVARWWWLCTSPASPLSRGQRPVRTILNPFQQTCTEESYYIRFACKSAVAPGSFPP